MSEFPFPADVVRSDFIPKEDYVSPEFLALETELLWPKVWQIACREEEIVRPGQYVTYDVANETIVVLRARDGTIKAFHNVCPHRARRLTTDCGQVAQLVCRWHGWRFSLDGECTYISDETDWGGVLKKEDVGLKPVKVGTWGGFVFINMDLDAEPLEAFLDPVAELCDPFEFENLRFRWYRTSITKCNWKIALEGFSEGYHIAQSHGQLLSCMEDYTVSFAYGRHGAFDIPTPPDKPSFSPSRRLGMKDKYDVRKHLAEAMRVNYDEVDAIISSRARDASVRVLERVAEDASPTEVMTRYADYYREVLEEQGTNWPEKLTPEALQRSHQSWFIFPNTIIVLSIDALILYRGRPNGDDPHTSIFDVWSLQRYAPGKEPPLKREFYDDIMEGNWKRILLQDYEHYEQVQKGLKSSAMKGLRPNPVQEVMTSNSHRALREFLADGYAKTHNAR